METLNKSRKSTLVYKKNKIKRKAPPLILATKFNPLFKQLGKLIRKHLHLTENDATATRLLPRPPIIAYRKHRNLKEYLTSAKL